MGHEWCCAEGEFDCIAIGVEMREAWITLAVSMKRND